jgi:hypothetical protein
MKAYLVTTGVLFGLLALVHVWRAIEEWPDSTVGLGFIVETTVVVLLPGVLAWWAWRVLRNLSDDRIKRAEKIQTRDSNSTAV